MTISTLLPHISGILATISPLIAQTDTDASGAAAAAAGGGVGGICGLLVAVLMIAGMWKVFSKAGQPGWAAIIPIYNYVVWCKVVGRPLWWVLVTFLCFPIGFIVLSIDLAKSFGKGTGFAVGLILLPFIFWPALGFGSATYVGPAAAPSATPAV